MQRRPGWCWAAISDARMFDVTTKGHRLSVRMWKHSVTLVWLHLLCELEISYIIQIEGVQPLHSRCWCLQCRWELHLQSNLRSRWGQKAFVEAVQFLEKAAHLKRYFDTIRVPSSEFPNRKYDCSTYPFFPIKLCSTLICFSLDDQPVHLHNQNYLSVGESMVADLASTSLFFPLFHRLSPTRVHAEQVHEHVRATRPDSSGWGD